MVAGEHGHFHDDGDLRRDGPVLRVPLALGVDLALCGHFLRLCDMAFRGALLARPRPPVEGTRASAPRRVIGLARHPNFYPCTFIFVILREGEVQGWIPDSRERHR